MDGRAIEYAMAGLVMLALLGWVALLLIWYVGGFC